MPNELLTRLTIGSWIQIGHPVVAEIMASAGFDWLAIDLEHTAITIRDAEDLIRVIDLKGVVPFVRLSANNPEQIKRVMDSGAHGVIVPMVKSVEDARNAVRAVKYPPHGERSIGLGRAQGYGKDFQGYFDWQTEGTLVIVQIEHIEAINNLRGILSVPGIDAYIVGPYDLSGSMGKPGAFNDPEFLTAIDQIRQVSKELGIPGGVHIVEPDTEALRDSIAQGNQFIALGMDTTMLNSTCHNVLKIACAEKNP